MACCDLSQVVVSFPVRSVLPLCEFCDEVTRSSSKFACGSCGPLCPPGYSSLFPFSVLLFWVYKAIFPESPSLTHFWASRWCLESNSELPTYCPYSKPKWSAHMLFFVVFSCTLYVCAYLRLEPDRNLEQSYRLQDRSNKTFASCTLKPVTVWLCSSENGLNLLPLIASKASIMGLKVPLLCNITLVFHAVVIGLLVESWWSLLRQYQRIAWGRFWQPSTGAIRRQSFAALNCCSAMLKTSVEQTYLFLFVF